VTTLVVPLGSHEQHGPHLPLDTDTRIVSAVVERACQGRDDVEIAPVFPFGDSGEHLDFPGTLSIGTPGLREALIALGNHTPEGARILFANAHGGNVEAVEAAAARLRGCGRACATWHVRVDGGDAHAGRTETSLMLAIAPDTVRLDLAEAGNTTPIGELMPTLRGHGVKAVSPNGVLGDPAGASAEEGAVLLAELVAGLVSKLPA
jgi:mycofactocin system creatininase family protein